MKKIILSFIAIFLVFNIYKTAFAAKHYTSIYYQGTYSTINKQIHLENYVINQLFFTVPKIKIDFAVTKDFLLPAAWCYSQNNTPIQIIFKGKELNGYKSSFSVTSTLLPMLSGGVMYNIKMIGYCNNKAEIKFYIHYSSKKMIIIHEKMLFSPYKTYVLALATDDTFAAISNKKGKTIGLAMPRVSKIKKLK
ncbi:MAG: hypothetical protein EVJ48_01885 [Candidatus Acidulodesulfobacterium acidiphilum]|uniref:Uncharacterized protein n=1 Tax=Candidatus Acidulodesulfobacterium acidiphilum TaxID=2597224 RepID=A0A520XGG3_9DELT|nr:MAG: hypothetical protein EVJ48_01885 [Candidatus Acidulodesulfobacterium acidiphilum]